MLRPSDIGYSLMNTDIHGLVNIICTPVIPIQIHHQTIT